VQSAVLRECILNLARLKESIAQSVGGTLDTAGLDAWPELMRGLKAGLLMLGKSRAVELVESIQVRLAPLMQPGGSAALTGGRLDHLADAIVSLEYYMETLQAGRSDPWYMLDNAQACLDALEAQPAPPVPTVAPLEQSAFAQTVQIGGGAAAVRAQMEAAAKGQAGYPCSRDDTHRSRQAECLRFTVEFADREARFGSYRAGNWIDPNAFHG